MGIGISTGNTCIEVDPFEGMVGFDVTFDEGTIINTSLPDNMVEYPDGTIEQGLSEAPAGVTTATIYVPEGDILALLGMNSWTPSGYGNPGLITLDGVVSGISPANYEQMRDALDTAQTINLSMNNLDGGSGSIGLDYVVDLSMYPALEWLRVHAGFNDFGGFTNIPSTLVEFDARQMRPSTAFTLDFSNLANLEIIGESQNSWNRDVIILADNTPSLTTIKGRYATDITLLAAGVASGALGLDITLRGDDITDPTACANLAELINNRGAVVSNYDAINSTCVI